MNNLVCPYSKRLQYTKLSQFPISNLSSVLTSSKRLQYTKLSLCFSSVDNLICHTYSILQSVHTSSKRLQYTKLSLCFSSVDNLICPYLQYEITIHKVVTPFPISRQSRMSLHPVRDYNTQSCHSVSHQWTISTVHTSSKRLQYTKLSLHFPSVDNLICP